MEAAASTLPEQLLEMRPVAKLPEQVLEMPPVAKLPEQPLEMPSVATLPKQPLEMPPVVKLPIELVLGCPVDTPPKKPPKSPVEEGKAEGLLEFWPPTTLFGGAGDNGSTLAFAAPPMRSWKLTAGCPA